jgi:hypothetical protein
MNINDIKRISRTFKIKHINKVRKKRVSKRLITEKDINWKYIKC